MSLWSLARKELIDAWRRGVLLPLSILVFAVMLAAVVLSWQRAQHQEAERRAAATTDREVWTGQGSRNPHSAAHFSRYAFKASLPVSFFDPGEMDHSGLAVWMEAHSQNPAVFLRAEDGGELQGLAALTPAWVLQALVPLLVVFLLSGSFAGERQDGTLKQLLASGVRIRTVLAGKLLGVLAVLAVLLLPAFLPVAVGMVQAAGTAGASGELARPLALAGFHGVYLLTFGLLALGISALSRSRRGALAVALCCWVASVILLPRLSADVAPVLSPAPSSLAMAERLSDASGAYWRDQDLQQAETAALLEEHGVEDIASLPFNFQAYQLQRSEEQAHPLFEAAYGDLAAAHRRQDAVLRGAGLLSPTLALSRLSAGLAATDRLHHEAFTRQAEAHRREIVEMLNEDMRTEAGAAGYAYAADEELWNRIPDFEHRVPALSSMLPHYLPEAAVLAFWLLASLAFVAWAGRRAALLEVSR